MADEKNEISQREVGEMSAHLKNLCREMGEVKDMIKSLAEKADDDRQERHEVKEQAGRNATAIKVLMVFIPIIATTTVFAIKAIVGDV